MRNLQFSFSFSLRKISCFCLRRLAVLHPPYLQDHLDNLMEASTLPSDVPVPQSLALGRRDAFLDPSRVAAYEFVEVGETVEVLPVLDRLERATTTRTFSEVSERLGDVMNQVLDLEEVAGG